MDIRSCLFIYSWNCSSRTVLGVFLISIPINWRKYNTLSVLFASSSRSFQKLFRLSYVQALKGSKISFNLRVQLVSGMNQPYLLPQKLEHVNFYCKTYRITMIKFAYKLIPRVLTLIKLKIETQARLSHALSHLAYILLQPFCLLRKKKPYSIWKTTSW